MTPPDLIAAAREVKQTAAILREARRVLRDIDKLAAVAAAGNDPALPDVTALQAACDRLVSRLAHREQHQKRRARETIGRGR